MTFTISIKLAYSFIKFLYESMIQLKHKKLIFICDREKVENCRDLHLLKSVA